MLSVLIIVSVCIVFYLVGYKFYVNILDRKVIKPNDSCPTSSKSMRDHVDFYPAKKPVLFGHHFASITGAGPIIGPIVAIGYFGWLATLGWWESGQKQFFLYLFLWAAMVLSDSPEAKTTNPDTSGLPSVIIYIIYP
jgi:hypothetical protein